MTALDTRFRALARRMIDSYGMSVTLSRAAETFDETTNMPTVGTPTTYSLKISPPTFAEIAEIDGVDVLATDMFCKTPAATTGGSNVAGLPPNTDKDTIAVGGVNYRVIGFNPVYSGEEIAAYALHLRR